MLRNHSDCEIVMRVMDDALEDAIVEDFDIRLSFYISLALMCVV